MASNNSFTFPGWFVNNNPLYKDSFNNVIQWGDNSYKRYYGGWHGASNTVFIATDVPNTSAVVDFSNAWNGCLSLSSFPSIDTCNGKNFQCSWQDCRSLSAFPWICTTKAETVVAAWASCTSLTSLPLIDLYNCKDFSYAWFNCSNLTDLPRLSTHNGKNFNMFVEGCPKLSSAPLQGTRENHSFANCDLQAPAIIDIFIGLADVKPARRYIDITNNPGVPSLTYGDYLIAWEKGWGVIPESLFCPEVGLEDSTCIDLEGCVHGTYSIVEKESSVRMGPGVICPTPTPTPTATNPPPPTPSPTPTPTPTTPAFDGLLNLMNFDSSNAYPPGEVYTDTSSDGLLFAQAFSGSSSKNAVIATLTPIDIYYVSVSGGVPVAIHDMFLTIEDTALGMIFQIYMQYSPSVIGTPFRIEISGKRYASMNPNDMTYTFPGGFNNIVNITV